MTTISERIELLRCKARIAKTFPALGLTDEEAAELTQLEAGLDRLARAVLRLAAARQRPS